MLHIVNKSLLFDNCLQYANVGDDIILIEEGINVLKASLLENKTSLISLHALESDLPKVAKPLTYPALAQINLIDYTQFVALVIKHPQTLTWF